MADLQNVTYGEQAFTIPAYDDTALSERVAYIEGMQSEYGRAIGDLNKLITTAKDSLVNAINEIAGAAGGFVAEYQVTTAQEVIEYLDGGGTAPVVVKRGNDYYTAIMTQKVNDTRVAIRALGTISGSYYVFTYTINGSTWSNASHGLQNLLVSGTNIKTINGQTVLGSGDLSV